MYCPGSIVPDLTLKCRPQPGEAGGGIQASAPGAEERKCQRTQRRFKEVTLGTRQAEHVSHAVDDRRWLDVVLVGARDRSGDRRVVYPANPLVCHLPRSYRGYRTWSEECLK